MTKTYLILLFILFLTSCEEGYEKSFWGTVTFDESEITVHDSDSFEILSHDFARDDIRGYYRGIEIKNSDGKSFKNLDDYYSIDSGFVYFSDNYLDGQSYYFRRKQYSNRLVGESPKAFKLLNKHYAKGAVVYYKGSVLANAEAATFEALSEGFGKDHRRVFYHNRRMLKADAKSFKPLKSNFGKDHYSVFYNSIRIEEAHPKTFEVLNGSFAKDKNHVYRSSFVVDSVDARTFEFYGESLYAKDKNSIFYRDIRLKGVTSSNFQISKNMYCAKWDSVYFFSERRLDKSDQLYEFAVKQFND